MSVRGCEVVATRDGVDRAAARAAEVLKGGGVILYPTDTIYGLGCLATDREAVRRVYALKGRPESKPSLVLVNSFPAVSALAAAVPPAARKLMEACWPGPLTIVLEAAHGVPEDLTAGTGKIGMRLPDDRFCVETVRRAGGALVSTSANRSGEAVEMRFDRLYATFGPEVDLAVDGGELRGRPSTVADLSGGALVIVREGALSGAELARLLDRKP